MISVCRRRSVGSKCAPKGSVNSVRSVRDKTPHCEYPTIFLSQKITEEQNTQTFTETLSQPISQSVTANVSWKASVNSVCRRPSVGSKCAQMGSVKSVSSVRENLPTYNFPKLFFSQKNTEEQNTQRCTETLSQPISQSVTTNFSWKASVFSVCRRRSVGSKCAPKGSVNSVRSVRDKTPHCEYPTIFLSQKITEEQNTQKSTETLSQPITQNVTANVSWKASVNSVCRRRSVGSKCAPKGSVNSVRSVRDKTPHCEYLTIFLSQKITEEQNTQHSTEILSQPISQSVTANLSWKASVFSVCRRRSVGSKRAPKGSVNSVRSVREKTPQQVS